MVTQVLYDHELYSAGNVEQNEEKVER